MSSESNTFRRIVCDYSGYFCSLMRLFCFRLLAKSKNWRSWSIDAIRNEYYRELNIRFNIGEGLRCSLVYCDATESFSEIFIKFEYAGLLKSLQFVPRTWLDLGCHQGFFTLWLLRERAIRGLPLDVTVVAVDADERSLIAVDSLIDVNPLIEGRIKFLWRAVGSGKSIPFIKRKGMGSSAIRRHESENAISVPSLRPQDITDYFPNGCDFAKVDIEGSEDYFLANLRDYLPKVKYLLLEWHVWSTGEGCDQASAFAACNAAGLVHLKTITSPRVYHLYGSSMTCGVELFEEPSDKI